MGFTPHSNSTTSAASSGVSQATSAVAVTAGDVVIVYGGNGGSQAVNSIDDGNGHTATLLTAGSNGVDRFVIGYWLSAPTGGASITYTANYAGGAVDRIVGVWVFTPSASASLDGATSGPATGTSATILSNTLTTSGSDCLIFGACYGAGAGFSSPLIGGAAATSSDSDGPGAMWYKATTGSGVAAQISQTSGRWIVDAISFQIAAADTLMAQGVM